MFVDEAQICVRGGDGGAGAAAFLREFRRPHGGPSGGDGGKGGDVILIADASVSTLLRFKNEIHLKAESGTHGGGKKKHGRTGEDRTILVPGGTVVRTLEGEAIADLVNVGDAVRVANGGRGGRGNARFLSNRRRAPGFAEQGEAGEELWIRLELKLMADVALVGFPNAGKSTLISAVSAAKPKIADYPFTTLTPNLGVAAIDDGELVIADIPGLIEGAAEGKGLGHRFLRHIERASVLCILLDPLNPSASVGEQYETLLSELGRYRAELLDRPRFVALNKIDAGVAAPLPVGVEIFEISAVARKGLTPLLRAMRAAVDEVRVERGVAGDTGFVIHRPVPHGYAIERAPWGWDVIGADARRAVALQDLTDSEAIMFVQDRLRGLGVFDALAVAGAVAGDEVRIGDLEFEYTPEIRDR